MLVQPYTIIVLLASAGRRLSLFAMATEDVALKEEMSANSQLSEVQATSLLVAYLRHMETTRSRIGNNQPPSPPLIQDDFAQILLDQLLVGNNNKHMIDQWRQDPFLPLGINMLAIRTRTIGDWLLQGKGHAQIVNLGAGMCTRPYRLDCPGLPTRRQPT
jgi:O-methyltransferase involved in polyketide biosynthesis